MDSNKVNMDEQTGNNTHWGCSLLRQRADRTGRRQRGKHYTGGWGHTKSVQQGKGHIKHSPIFMVFSKESNLFMQAAIKWKVITHTLLFSLVFFYGSSVSAEKPGNSPSMAKVENVSYHPSGSTGGTANQTRQDLANLSQPSEYIFSSPPRGNGAVEAAIFQPVADYLSKATGKKFVYKYSENWLAYQSNMQKDKYDLVFDGPHFVSWRISHRGHEPLVKIPGDFIFVFLARKDNNSIQALGNLAGRTVCGHAPPNQGTLHLYNMFDNPSRQPQLVEVQGWRNIYKEMLAGKCLGSVVPLKIYKELDPDGKDAKVLHITRAAPGQAFTASKRIPAEIRAKIADALMSAEGQEVTAELRQQYPSKPYIRATKQEYAGEDVLLKDSHGFDS